MITILGEKLHTAQTRTAPSNAAVSAYVQAAKKSKSRDTKLQGKN